MQSQCAVLHLPFMHILRITATATIISIVLFHERILQEPWTEGSYCAAQVTKPPNPSNKCIEGDLSIQRRYEREGGVGRNAVVLSVGYVKRLRLSRLKKM